jgi:hypothetical protein
LADEVSDARRAAIVRKPSAVAVLIALIPFAAMCFSVPFWDRINPMIFGLPFNLFWLAAWIGLSSLCMLAAYRIDLSRYREGEDGP